MSEKDEIGLLKIFIEQWNGHFFAGRLQMNSGWFFGLCREDISQAITPLLLRRWYFGGVT